MRYAPLVSVIVVCRNSGLQVRHALESVWDQEPEAPDVVVVDGASHDGTREWLESQQDRLTVVDAMPDTEPYAAMNRGIQAARGEWALFLGAGDRLADVHTVASAAQWLRQTHAGVVAGQAVYEDGRTHHLGRRPRFRARNFVHHQGAFYRRSLFQAYGGFDESFRLMADYDLNLRWWRRGVAFRSLRLRVAQCGPGDLRDSGDWQGYAEEMRVRHRHFPAWRCWMSDAGSLARFVRKRVEVSWPRRSLLRAAVEP
jgi:putative colanic acid biosynthesis glycosyltransferase